MRRHRDDVAGCIFGPSTPPRLRACLGLVLSVVGVAPWVVPLGPLHFLLTLPICWGLLVGLAVVARRHEVRASTVPG